MELLLKSLIILCDNFFCVAKEFNAAVLIRDALKVIFTKKSIFEDQKNL